MAEQVMLMIIFLLFYNFVGMIMIAFALLVTTVVILSKY